VHGRVLSDLHGRDRGQGAAPDVFEHLLAAAREFFLAARAVIDVRGDHVSGVDASQNGRRTSSGSRSRDEPTRSAFDG
jgi:hypothetical protein